MPASTVFPFDLQTDQEAITRKQQVAQALLSQMMQMPQGQMVSGHFVAPSPLQYLAQAAGTYFGGKMLNQADDAKRELTGKYNNALAAGLQKYFDTREGKPGQTMTDQQASDLLNNDQAPQLAEPIKADPRRAMVEALTSQFPELRQLGQMEFASTLKGDATPETFGHSPVTEKDATGKLISVLYGSKGTRRVVGEATPYEKPIVVADRLVDPSQPDKPLANYETTGGEVRTDERGDKYQLLSNGQWKKLDNAPNVKITTNTTVAGQKAGFEEWSKLAAKTVSDMADKARGSVRLVSTLNQLDKLDQNGVYSGPTAQVAQFFGGLGQALGVPVDTARLGNSQTYNAAATEAVQQMIAQLGGNRAVTAPEAEQIARMAPQLVMSPQGRKQISAYLRNLAQRTVEDAQSAAREYSTALQSQDPRQFTFGLSAAQLPSAPPLEASQGAAMPSEGTSSPAPQAPAGKPAPGTISVQEWLRK